MFGKLLLSRISHANGTTGGLSAAALLCVMILITGCDSNPSSTRSATATEITSTRDNGTTSVVNNRKARTVSHAKGGASTASAHRNTRVDDKALTQPMVAIKGKVTFEDGAPVTTGTITLTSYAYQDGTMKRQDPVKTAIEKDGSYFITAPDARYHSTEVSGNFPTTTDGISGIEASAAPKLREVTQDFKIQRGVEVRGLVVDEHDQPVADASVLIRKRAENRNYNPGTSSQAETSSTATGEFVFPYVAPATSLVIANHPDLASGSQEIEVPTTGPVIVRMLRGGATVTGHVYRQDTGAPFAGATVTVHEKEDWQPYPKKADSQPDGSFRVEHVSPGKVTIAVASNDTSLGPYPSEDSPLGKTTTMADGDTTNVTLFLYGGHTVTGRVFDRETQEPLAGAEIRTEDGRSSTTSGADGQYQITRVFAGGARSNVNLRPALEGYTAAVEDRNQRPDYVPVRLSIDELTVQKDLPMVKQVIVSGTVKTRDGVPVPQASVGLKIVHQMYSGEEKAEKTEADGNYRLEVRPFSDGVVKAEAAGYATGYSEAFTVDNKDIDGMDITLDVGASIAGTVIDPEGKPVEKARVSASTTIWIGSYGIGDSNGSDETDAEGRFLLSNLPKQVNISAHHDEYSSSKSEQVALTPGESRTNMTLQLRSSHSISGRVVDANDQPLESVHVYASGESHSSSNSAKDGSFELKKLVEGVYRLSASGQGGHTSLEGVKSGTSDVVLRLSSSAADRGQATLIGTVVDAATEEPVEDFEIENLGTKTTKDPSTPGRFTAEGLTRGVTYSAKIRAPGYVVNNAQVLAPADKSRFEHTFKIGKGGAITGTVVEAETQKPMPNITVVNWGNTRSEYDRRNVMPSSTSTTDEEGNFTLAPAPIGDNAVIVRPKSPLAEVTVQAKVENEEITDLGKIEISRGGVIHGTLTTGAGKEPLPNATITIYGHDQQNIADAVRKSASTDAEGKFRFEGLPARNYSLSVSRYSISKSVELALGAEEQVDLHVGGIRVFGVVTRGGEPVRCSVSAVLGSSDATRVSTSAQSGSYELTGLSAGEWKFQIHQYGSSAVRSYEETVTIPDTDEFEKDFQLPDIRISGIVVDSSGEPVPGATAMLSQKNTSAGAGDGWRGGFNASTSTDNEGRFKFEGMTEGTYQVAARKEGAGSAMEPGVQVRDGSPVDLRLELSPNGGTLVSVALNMATGAGLPEAWCYLYGENGRFTHAAQRGPDGVMTIKDIPPGTYRANVSYWSFSQSEHEVEIKAGETVTIEDVLYPAGAIEWTLQKADGTPATATGTANPVDADSIESPKSASTDATGKLVIRGLAPGNYQVTAQAQGKAAVSDTFTVIAGDIARKTTAVPGW